jgi:hypothetical protein
LAVIATPATGKEKSRVLEFSKKFEGNEEGNENLGCRFRVFIQKSQGSASGSSVRVVIPFGKSAAKAEWIVESGSAF